MSNVFEDSKKILERVREIQKERGQREPSAPSAAEIAKRAAREMRCRTQLSQEGLHRPLR